jgi:hypothetical protein
MWFPLEFNMALDEWTEVICMQELVQTLVHAFIIWSQAERPVGDVGRVEGVAMRAQTVPNDVSHFRVPLFGTHLVAFFS